MSVCTSAFLDLACSLDFVVAPIGVSLASFSFSDYSVHQFKSLKITVFDGSMVTCAVCPTVSINGSKIIDGPKGSVDVRDCTDVDAHSELPPAVAANLKRMMGCDKHNGGYLRLEEIAQIKEAVKDYVPDEVIDSVLFSVKRDYIGDALKKQIAIYAVTNCMGTKYIMNVLRTVSAMLYGTKRIGLVTSTYTPQQRDVFCIKKLKELGASDEEIEEYRKLRERINNPPVVAAYVYSLKRGAKYAQLFGVTEQEVRILRRKLLGRGGNDEGSAEAEPVEVRHNSF